MATEPTTPECCRICVPTSTSINGPNETEPLITRRSTDGFFFNLICMLILTLFLFIGIAIGIYLMIEEEEPVLKDFVILPKKKTSIDLMNLRLPVDNIILIDTQTPDCYTKEKCLKIALNNNLDYNYLIGSDGNVYQNAGWLRKTCGDESSLCLGILGQFNIVTQQQLKLIQEFINLGIKDGYLKSCYTLHDQNMEEILVLNELEPKDCH